MISMSARPALISAALRALAATLKEDMCVTASQAGMVNTALKILMSVLLTLTIVCMVPAKTLKAHTSVPVMLDGKGPCVMLTSMSVVLGQQTAASMQIVKIQMVATLAAAKPATMAQVTWERFIVLFMSCLLQGILGLWSERMHIQSRYLQPV
jgi:hypothetical protein